MTAKYQMEHESTHFVYLLLFYDSYDHVLKGMRFEVRHTYNLYDPIETLLKNGGKGTPLIVIFNSIFQ